MTLYETIIDSLATQDYSVVHNFFSEAELTLFTTELLDKFQQNQFKKATIGTQKQVVEEVRGDYILWINDEKPSATEKLFFDKINSFVTYLNTTCYTGIKSYEFFYALYPNGAYYHKHLDNFKGQNNRKYTFICYLNQGWTSQQAGQLVIYPTVNQPITINPQFGTTLIFNSQTLPHEVLPTTTQRLSITGWLK